MLRQLLPRVLLPLEQPRLVGGAGEEPEHQVAVLRLRRLDLRLCEQRHHALAAARVLHVGDDALQVLDAGGGHATHAAEALQQLGALARLDKAVDDDFAGGDLGVARDGAALARGAPREQRHRLEQVGEFALERAESQLAQTVREVRTLYANNGTLKSQIALRQADLGTPVAEVCRKMGVSEATYFRWKQKYGGMEASDVKRLKDLELENSRLKRLLADTILDKEILKDVIEKKGWGPTSGGSSSR